MKTFNFKKITILLFLFVTNWSILSAQTFTDEEKEMLRLVNNLRIKNGREPVQLNASLNQAAFDHSEDMGENNYFSHTGRNGSKFGERAKDAGYKGSPRGENIAAGRRDVAATFKQWENSSGHRRNILNPNINEMGIGHAHVPGSKYRHYWTQMFGKGDPNVLSVGENLSDGITAVYPNPTRKMLNIDLDPSVKKTSELYITAVTGQVVQKIDRKPSGNLAVDVSALPAGIYFLNSPETKAIKIVKI